MQVSAAPAPPLALDQYSAQIFSTAYHPVIDKNTSASVVNAEAQREGFQILQQHVAPAAFHNSKQRVDPPRCHPRTRQAVLEELFDWIVGNVPRKAWIAWLSGAAGAGKSAICQSFAEICIQRGIKAASFFFFRTDATRNTIDPVIATLAYQIIQILPEAKDLISQSIESHPLIFEQSFETQFDELIVTPVRCLRTSDASLTLLLIIDGVDECMKEESQTDLIHTFGRLLQHKDLPIVILISSRRESQIQMAFNARDMDGILKQLQLDSNYKAEGDIRLFLVESFRDIKRTHPLRRRLGPAWPATEQVQQIVDKSSGQFVYAAIVIKFVSMPSSNPSTQLEIVCGLRPAGRATPFAELDALYHHIFSNVDDIATALDFIAYAILLPVHSVQEMFRFFDITEDDGECILLSLTCVLSYDIYRDKIVFHHASLADFLRDRGRAGAYCISDYGTHLSMLWFKHAASGRYKNLSRDHQCLELCNLLAHAEASPDLRALMLDYTPLQTPSAYSWNFFPKDTLTCIQIMDFDDNGEVYNTMFD